MNRISRFKKVTHVLFDMDGVLLDSERLYMLAMQNVFGRLGKTYDWSTKLQIMGMPGKEASKKLVQLLELSTSPEELYSMLQAEYTIIMKDVKLMPGAAALVGHLYSHKVPIAVATSSAQASFELKTKNHKNFFCQFNHIVCGGDDPEVKRGKPKPDIFLVCASRFVEKPCPDKCLVFEDAPNGVRAAVSAGMQVVMVPDENVPKELRKDAQVVVKRIDQAPLELFGLPALKTCPGNRR